MMYVTDRSLAKLHRSVLVRMQTAVSPTFWRTIYSLSVSMLRAV